MKDLIKKTGLFFLVITCFITFLTSPIEAENVVIETKYSLHNPDEKWHIESARLQLTLPRVGGNDYCNSIEQKLSGYPAEYTTDDKGNQIATYNFPYIAAEETKNFTIVTLYEEFQDGDIDVLADKSELDGSLIEDSDNDLYTLPSDKIESDAPDITAKTESLTEGYGEDEVYEKIEAIFEYVSTYKSDDLDDYDSSYANQGALSAYEIIEEYLNTGDDEKNIVCEDYASLMTALLRAEGIPARTVLGFKIPEDIIDDEISIDSDDMEDYRHMWVEYWVEYEGDEKWLPADPTPSYFNNAADLDYFVDIDSYYIYDSYDVTDPSQLYYRSYKQLSEDDFYYEYKLEYEDDDDISDSDYDNFIEKPEVELGDDIENITLKPDQVGFLHVNIRESSLEKIKSMRWVSEDETVAKVENGYITPVGEGTTTVYVVVNGIRTQDVTVEIESGNSNDTLDNALIKLEQITLYPGRKIELPTLESASIAGGSGASINWRVDDYDEGIVTINNGILEALQEGFATIYAELAGVKKSVEVRVLAEARIADVDINPQDDFIVGQPTEVQVVVYIVGNDGNKTPIADVPAELTAEKADAYDITVIDESKRLFNVTPLEFEETKLIANSREVESTLNIEPKELEEDTLSLNVDRNNIKIGEEESLNLSTTDSYYKDILDSIPISWDYDDEIISVEGENGNYKLTAENSGTTVLQARAGNTRSNPVMIVVEAPELKNFTIEISDELIKIGESATLTITAEDENGEEYSLENSIVNLSTEFDDIVEITQEENENNTYTVKGIKEGRTRINASLSGLNAETSIEVYKPKPVELNLNVPSEKLVIGEVMEVVLTATDQDGEDFDLANSSVDIILSRDDLVDISNKGFEQIFIEGRKIGALRIYAEVQGIQSNSENIAIIPVSTEIDNLDDDECVLGDETTLIAEAYDGDGKTLELDGLDAGLEWKVADTNILEIVEEEIDDDEGELKVKAVGIGETYVTASVLGVNSTKTYIKVLPELNFEVKDCRINFALDRMHMNIGDKIRIASYQVENGDDDIIQGDINSSDADEEIITLKDAGRSIIVEAVGEGSAEIYFDNLEDDLVSDRLVIVVGTPGDTIEVGELSYDVKEKSMLLQIPQEYEKNKFKDAADHWANEDISLASEMGIVGGYENNEFLPDKNVSRAEFVVMLTRALGIETEEKTTTFKDLKNHWSKNSVENLKELNVIGGYGDGTFKPNKEITRAEVAAMISKILASESNAEGVFTDVEESNWAAPYINKVAGLGLVNGVGEGNFAPGKNTTRAEAVTIIMRLLRGLNR